MRYFLSCMLIPLTLIVQTSAAFSEIRIYTTPKPDPNKSFAENQEEGIRRKLESQYYYGIRILLVGLDTTGKSRVAACLRGSRNEFYITLSKDFRILEKVERRFKPCREKLPEAWGLNRVTSARKSNQRETFTTKTIDRKLLPSKQRATETKSAALETKPLAVTRRDRIALVIANQDYNARVGRLVNPLNDARIVGDALRKIGFQVMRPVKNATRSDIMLALDKYASRLSKAGPDAVGFVYYSGHGLASRGSNYLVPIDIEKPTTRLLRAKGIKQSEVLSLLKTEAPQAAHYIVIDACRNELQGSRGGKGFIPVTQQSGALIAFATAPGKTASDIGDGSGPYARALAAELVKPGVPDLLMFHNVRVAVSKATEGDQIPWTLDGIQRQKRLEFGTLKQN